jgi:cellulase/cellobiase CelA1
MFANAYNQARTIAPKRPVMIGEVGSSEDGGNKAQWINDMSTALNSGRYPDLKMVVYFDQDKEELWSGTSSAAAKTAFTSWLNQAYMKGTGTGLAQVAAQYKGTTTPPTNSWAGGFQGDVTVRAGTSPVNGWTVRWTLASGQTITQLWNGALSVSGPAVTVKNLSGNGSLAANGTATFGFLSNGSPSTPTLTCTSP